MDQHPHAALAMAEAAEDPAPEEAAVEAPPNEPAAAEAEEAGPSDAEPGDHGPDDSYIIAIQDEVLCHPQM